MKATQKKPEPRHLVLWSVGVVLFAVGGVGAWWIGSKGEDPLDRLRAPRPQASSRSYVDDPIDLANAPLVADAEWGRSTVVGEFTRKVSGRVVDGEGRPLAGLPYWLTGVSSLPREELRGDLPKGSIWKPLAPPLASTGPDGSFTGYLAVAGKVTLVLRMHTSLMVAAEVPDTGIIAIADLAPITVAASGLGAQATLRLGLTPTFARHRLMRRGYGGARDIVLPAESAAIAFGMLRGELEAEITPGKPLEIAWPKGRAADIAFDGLGFDLVPAQQAVEAGARVEPRFGRRFAMLKVSLPEPARSRLGGFAVLSFRPDPSESRRRDPLRAGSVLFDLRASEDSTYVIDVVDGAMNHYHEEFLEKDLPKSGELELGLATARRPLVIRVADRPGLTGAKLYCEKSDRVVVLLTKASEYTFVVDEYGAWSNPQAGEYLLADAPKDWRQIFFVLADGEVARVSSDPRTEVTALWLPSEALPEQDLVELARKHFGTRSGEIFFQLDLPTLDSAPEEVRCDHLSAPRQLEQTPVWRKRVPKGYASRLVMLVPDEVFEIVPLSGLAK